MLLYNSGVHGVYMSRTCHPDEYVNKNSSSFHIKDLKPLDSLCRGAGWFVSDLLRNAGGRFSNNVAYM